MKNNNNIKLDLRIGIPVNLIFLIIDNEKNIRKIIDFPIVNFIKFIKINVFWNIKLTNRNLNNVFFNFID